MALMSMQDIRSLGVSERILLAERLWESIPEEADEAVLSAVQKKELVRRLESLRDGKAATTTWEDVRQKLRARR